MKLYIASILSLFISIMALAVAVAHRSDAADQTTWIETDQRSNAIRIFADGEQVVQIDGTGLHVRDDVRYGGVTADYGRPGFAAHINKKGGERRQ